jgi:hypothetical protein
MIRYFAAALCAASLLGGCAQFTPAPASVPERSVASLRFIGEQRIPLKQEFQGTSIGGLSGVDYDPVRDEWVMESDDRSAINPARFYTARMDYDGAGFKSVTVTGMHLFRQADGSNYPGVKEFDVQRKGDVPDIEAIRVDPLDGSIWYASEGDRKRGLDPFVRHARRDGAYLATMPLPAMFRMSREETGPRDNLTFEGLSFAVDGKTLWVSMEAPLYQDGPLPSVNAGAMARINRFTRSGELLAQYAYPVDAIPAAPGPGKVADNGVSEILAVNRHALLVLERSAVQDAEGAYRNHVRVYEMDTAGASDVRGLASLAGADYRPAAKRLLLDLDTLGIRIDNLEAISWGHRLANGHDTLMIVSDDNFSKTQVTQFLLFEVIPSGGMVN